jgi:hypothetical protein
LPFIEQGNLHNATNFSSAIPGNFWGWDSADNSTTFGLQVSTFLCPSNPRDSRPAFAGQSGQAWQVEQAAVTDYLFNGGGDPFVSAPYVTQGLRGPFGFEANVRLAAITDGLSGTILLGESLGGNAANPRYAVGWGENRTCAPIQGFKGASGSKMYTGVVYENLMFMGYGREVTSHGIGIMGGLIARTVDASGAFYGPNDCGTYSGTGLFTPHLPFSGVGQLTPNFHSVHPGAVQVTMGDGSVRLIRSTIDRSAYVSLSSIAGSEVVSADAY